MTGSVRLPRSALRSGAGLLFASLLCFPLTFGAENAAPRSTPDLEARAQAFWQQAQEELFAGLELSADQRAGVDAIIGEAARDRQRAIELRKRLGEAGEADSKAAPGVRAELEELKRRLQPEWRINAMRELLSEEQRIVFDRNWRLRSDRLFAEERRRSRAP